MRDLESDADLETLYAAAKFPAAREDRRTTHTVLRDARGLTGASGDVTGLLSFTRELSGSRHPILADREPRAPAISAAMGVNLNHPKKRGRKRRAEREVPSSAKGRMVGAAQVPAHTHRGPALARSRCGNTLKECKRASKRKAN